MALPIEEQEQQPVQQPVEWAIARLGFDVPGPNLPAQMTVVLYPRCADGTWMMNQEKRITFTDADAPEGQLGDASFAVFMLSGAQVADHSLTQARGVASMTLRDAAYKMIADRLAAEEAARAAANPPPTPTPSE